MKKYNKLAVILIIFITVFPIPSFSQQETFREIVNMYEMYGLYKTLNHKKQTEFWLKKLQDVADTGNMLALRMVYTITKKISGKGYQAAMKYRVERERGKMSMLPEPPFFDPESGKINEEAIPISLINDMRRTTSFPPRHIPYYPQMDRGIIYRERDKLTEEIQTPITDDDLQLCQRSFKK